MDILAFVCRAEARSKAAKIAVAITALNAYRGNVEAYLVPGRRQDARQRFSTNVRADQVRQVDVDCAFKARELWSHGVRLGSAVSCYETSVQDKLTAAGYPGYRFDSHQLHERWTAKGMVLTAELDGWRFYAEGHIRGNGWPKSTKRRQSQQELDFGDGFASFFQGSGTRSS